MLTRASRSAAAKLSHALCCNSVTCSFLLIADMHMHDCIEKQGYGCKEALHEWQADNNQICVTVQGFYPGGTAIAFRQMTNWASRQGFTEAVRDQFKLRLHGSKSAKLSKTEEVGSGILGGVWLPIGV